MRKFIVFILFCSLWYNGSIIAQVNIDSISSGNSTIDSSSKILQSLEDTKIGKPTVVGANSVLKDTAKVVDTSLFIPFVTPKKKAMFAAIMPGLGQFYNRQFWKLPIVYGALGFGAYQIYYKNERYNYYRKIYAGRLSNKQEFIDMEANIPNDGIKYYQDAFREERDLAALLTVLGYGLQIMDALVFAHLKNFDITDDITLQIKPSYIPNYFVPYSPTVGLGLAFQLKR